MVAPDNRRAKVAEQLQRPAFSRVSELGSYLPYSQLEQNHASMSRFGSSIKPLLEISQRL
jgi:type II restriction enzyme